MNILIIGANGFIGSYITANFIKNNYQVTVAVKNIESTRAKFPHIHKIIYCDLNNPIDIEFWINELKSIDIVVNSAGVLTDNSKNKIENVHIHGPKSIYEACILANVKRIIHISALGIDEENTTKYASTKKILDDYIKSLNNIDWVIIKPSLVYSQTCYGGTSLLRSLSSFPYFIPLIGDGLQKFQPIHMNDLAKTVLFCTNRKDNIKIILKAVGPEILTIKEILLNFRKWLGLPQAKFIEVPVCIIKFLTKIGDLFRTGPLNTTSYKMMLKPNIANKEDFINYTSIDPVKFEDALFSEPSTIQSLWHARLFFFKPLTKFIFGSFWILTGIITMFFNPEPAIIVIQEIGFADGVMIMYISCLLDITLGIFLLLNKKTMEIYILQFLTILVYSLILTLYKPLLWADPFGSLTKNIPILLLIIILMSIEKEK